MSKRREPYGKPFVYAREIRECQLACAKGDRAAYDAASAAFWKRYPDMRAQSEKDVARHRPGVIGQEREGRIERLRSHRKEKP